MPTQGSSSNGNGSLEEGQIAVSRSADNQSDTDTLVVSETPEGKAWRFLKLLREQPGITVGQLARLLGVSREDMKRFVAEAVKSKWVDAGRLITGDDVWVWLDQRGAELVGSRFMITMPGLKDLRKLRAVNDVRIRFEIDSRLPWKWVCKRALRGEKRGTSHVPDAIVVVGNHRRVVEVELSSRPGSGLPDRIAKYEGEYDDVFYFVPSEVAALYHRQGINRDNFPKLRVVPMTVSSHALDQPDWHVGIEQLPQVARSNDPLSDLERMAIDLLAEQGAIPRDQLRRFLDLSEGDADRLIARFMQRELVECAEPLVDEPYWAWLTTVGARASQWDLVVQVPGLGNLERMRAINELRLRATRKDGVRWTGERVLRNRDGMRGSCPDAVVDVGAERHAFDVVLYAANHGELKTRLERREEDYKVMVWFYSPEAKGDLEKFAERMDCPGLVLRSLPPSRYLEERAWNRKRSARNDKSYCSSAKIWAELADSPPAVVYPIRIEAVPIGASEVVAVAGGLEERLPRIVAAWQRKIGGYPVYYLETDVGKFRVVKGKDDWIADEIAREDVFVKEGGPLVDPRRRDAWRAVPTRPLVESEAAQLSERVWAAVEGLIPSIEIRKNHRGAKGDREVLTALIWQVRAEGSVQKLPVGLMDGSGLRVHARLREWEDIGIWEEVRETLERLLPDGRELDWSKLSPEHLLKRRPFNNRQRSFLARAVREPDRVWTVEAYSASQGIRPDSGRGDLWKLAALGLVVHTKQDAEFVFVPADDLVSRLKRLIGK